MLQFYEGINEFTKYFKKCMSKSADREDSSKLADGALVVLEELLKRYGLSALAEEQLLGHLALIFSEINSNTMAVSFKQGVQPYFHDKSTINLALSLTSRSSDKAIEDVFTNAIVRYIVTKIFKNDYLEIAKLSLLKKI